MPWALAEAKRTGKKTLAPDETTPTSLTFANPDGTLASEVTAGPERMERDGKWIDVDATLTTTADGGVQAKAHPQGLTLASGGGTPATSLKAAQDDAGRDLVTLGTGDEQVTLQWKGGLPQPVLHGTTATYKDAVPGADVVVKATRTGFEQFVNLDAKPAVGDYTYTLPLKAKGLKATAQKGGSVLFTDATTGAERATMPAPMMWDASVDEVSGKHEHRAPVGMKVVDNGGGNIDLQVTPNAAFLADPSTQYPVTVDPSTSALGNTFDTYVQQGETTDLGGETELDFGNPGTKNADGTPRLARTLMSWNTEPFADALVSSASVQLYNFHSGATDCKAQSWTVWNTGDNSGARWTNQPTWMQQYATSTQTAGYPAGCTNTTDGWIKADVTDLVKVWASAKQTRGYMGIRAATDDVKGWKRVNSRNATANQPKLTVNYNYRPGDGTAQQAGAPFKSYAGVWAVNSTTPTLRDKFADADGDKVNGTFQVYDAATNKPITTPAGDGAIVSADVAPGAWASVKVPAGQLVNGKTYKFRTNSYDGAHYNLNWSPWREFVVDTTAPGVPAKIASTDYPAGAWTPNKGDGNFDVTPPAGDDARGIESRTNGGTWSAEKPAVAGKTTTVTGTPGERGMNRTEGRAVDRADNKGSEKVYDYGTGKKPISGDTAIPDGGDTADPIPEEEPYETEDVPKKQASPDGVVTDPKPGDRSNCYKTDSSDIEMCQSRTYNAEIKSAAKALPPPTNPLVTWCSDPAIGGYTLTRTEGCHKIGVVVDWWQISTNQPPKHIGTAIFLVREEMKLDNKAEWHQRNFISPLSIDGALGTVTLDYWDVTCGGDTVCDKELVGPEFTGPTSWTIASSVTEQTVQTRKFTWKTAALGKEQDFDRGNFLGFKATGAPGAVKITEPSWVFWGQVRCDQKMPNAASVGCVFPKYTPTFNLKQKYAEGAALYYMEMRDKLDWNPGSEKDNSPLHREFDKEKKIANRGVVCPDKGQYALVPHPLATGDSKATQCDEYAFAASKESGGSQAGVTNGTQCLQAYARKDADGKWRLYDDMRAPNTAPTYTEKCARATMAGAQNERAGSRLSGFYTKQRMLDDDAYFIDVPGLVRP
ncbi:DNRLRE domain-containing protein [Streptomyces beijiangensis]|uniref:DNRLRE domain-containing protein n=1 Tax=Streptomyces beijiangensis TaxID=163361 RepID=A0A939F6M8_9ACTN|nr:DNRLRE domain-containing protein [Streptomyces beijiangensis]